MKKLHISNIEKNIDKYIGLYPAHLAPPTANDHLRQFLQEILKIHKN